MKNIIKFIDDKIDLIKEALARENIKERNCLIYAFWYAIIFIIVKFILNKFNIDFMEWFYYFSFWFVFIIATIGMNQFVSKKDNKILKIFFVVIIIIISFCSIYIGSLMYRPEYVVKKDGQKFDVTIFYWDRLLEVSYYNYLNPFMRSYEVDEAENITAYSSSYNPFKSDSKYKQYLKFSLIHSIFNTIMQPSDK